MRTLSPDVIKGLLPTSSMIPETNLWDSFVKPQASMLDPLAGSLLTDIHATKMNWLNLRMSMTDGYESTQDYSEYLQYPNEEIKALVDQIVEPGDSNDEKAYKILMWVQDNIEYVPDFVNYSKSEYWAKPTETVNRDGGSGDCEDGAFLIHSMMLNAGIPYERIRTYGGTVIAGEGASTGGHGWTAYQRESDDEWVVLDWCYYANQDAIADRTPMKDSLLYIDDWFYFTAEKTIETPFANKVHNPDVVYGASRSMNFLNGQRVDVQA